MPAHGLVLPRGDDCAEHVPPLPPARMISLRAWLTARVPADRSAGSAAPSSACLPSPCPAPTASSRCSSYAPGSSRPTMRRWRRTARTAVARRRGVALDYRMDFLALAAALAQPPDDLVARVFAVGHHAEQLVGALGTEFLRREQQLRLIAQRQLPQRFADRQEAVIRPLAAVSGPIPGTKQTSAHS